MAKKVASSGLRENVILIRIILTTDGANGCVAVTNGTKGSVWYPRCKTINSSAVGVIQAV